MPAQWLPRGEDGAFRLRLVPHRALAPRGFAIFIGLTALLTAMPLLAALATPAFWGLLPFLLAALAAIWWALRRSDADRRINEELSMGRARLQLRRQGPRGQIQEWEAAPHWVALHLYPQGGPVPDYLTLTGGGREVELGAFLTPAERRDLHAELGEILARLRGADLSPPPGR